MSKKKEKIKGFKIVRTYSAGVFAGKIEWKKGKEVQMKEAIRLWGWAGAASLSQLALEGTKRPDGCKFGVPVSVRLTEAIEILDTTKEAEKSIKGVESWRM